MNTLNLIAYSDYSVNDTKPTDEYLKSVDDYNRQNFLNDLRVKRNQLLKETDWTTLPDVKLSYDLRKQYLAYRQALRDLPQNVTYDTLVWPTIPS
jgi:hypothetical protein